ncbi:MAG: hypothetical protein AVDCRST_MAG08-3266, partial [uncultured Acetobacteraceae bacterium]
GQHGAGTDARHLRRPQDARRFDHARTGEPPRGQGRVRFRVRRRGEVPGRAPLRGDRGGDQARGGQEL